jgi:hypothetical protein
MFYPPFLFRESCSERVFRSQFFNLREGERTGIVGVFMGIRETFKVCLLGVKRMICTERRTYLTGLE